MPRIAIVHHSACSAHDMGRGHPEQPHRLDAVLSALRGAEPPLPLDWREAPRASEEALQRAHSPAHVQRLLAAMRQAAQHSEAIAIDGDTTIAPGTHEAALRAAGAGVAAVDAVMAGEVSAAFCAVRPPGHHATAARAMGFCFFNNVAIAAHHALAVHGLSRVAIVDFDVHHGNGTEAIVAGDARILMAGTFQHPAYPGSGTAPLGENCINVPLAPGSDGRALRLAFEHTLGPALDAFAPELLLISAGFDAHADDPLAQLRWQEADYAWLTAQLCAIAQRHAQGRMVSFLEGGYDLPALGRSALAHVRALAQTASITQFNR